MQLFDTSKNWMTATQSELVAHIVDRYHDSLRQEMPVLIEAAHTVERTHAGKPAVPIGLAEALEEFWSEMQQHMMKEEQVLFPMLARGACGPQVYMPVRMMEREHDDHAAALSGFRDLTGNHVAPPHACATWRRLYTGLARLEEELSQHMHLENDILFPRATGR